MTDTLAFQRARTPEARGVRREAILAAAAELFDREGPAGAGLNAIAAAAGFTKSNVYRYFESREQVLLSLLLDAFAAFVPEIEQSLAACPQGDTAAIAHASARAFASHPRLAHLLSILANVLEQNVSVETIANLKRRMLSDLGRIAAAIASRLPGASPTDCAWVVGMTGALVAGMWPSTQPSPAAAEVLAREEFAVLRPNMERDLERAIDALLRSIVRPA